MGRNRIVFTVRLLIAVATVFMLGPTQSLAQSTTQKHYYDGRTLFRGFFLGHGPVAKLFPELYGHREPPTELVTAKEDALMDRISKERPDFFGQFEKLMNSGSRVDVDKALDEGSERLAEVLAPELGVTANDVRQGRTGNNAGTQLGVRPRIEV